MKYLNKLPKPVQCVAILVITYCMNPGVALGADRIDTMGGVGGGGGNIEEMRKAGSLKPSQIEDLLINNGQLIKSQLLVPAAKSFNVLRINDQEINQKYRAMLAGANHKLPEKIVWAPFRISDCSCLPSEDACRLKNGRETFTCFHVDRIASRNTSLAELVGLSMHELSRVFIPEDSKWQDDNHRLGDFFTTIIATGTDLNSPKYYVELCKVNVAEDSEELNSCPAVKNKYSYQCALKKGQGDAEKIRACGGVKTQGDLNCAIKNGSTRERISACITQHIGSGR